MLNDKLKRGTKTDVVREGDGVAGGGGGGEGGSSFIYLPYHVRNSV